MPTFQIVSGVIHTLNATYDKFIKNNPKFDGPVSLLVSFKRQLFALNAFARLLLTKLVLQPSQKDETV